MKKIFSLIFLAILTLFVSSCSNSSTNYKDGTYTGVSNLYSEADYGITGGYATCNLSIKDNLITACEIKLYLPDDTLKDSSYGSSLSEEYYNKAQNAIKAADEYAKALIGTNTVDSVDCISGATLTYAEFKEAVNNALNKAKA